MDSYTFFGHIVGIVGFNQSMLAQIELSGLGVLPEMNHRLAEKVQVMLTCHLAQACHIPEAVAHRIIRNCYEWQGVDTLTKNPPIVDSTSFRVTKMRMMPSP